MPAKCRARAPPLRRSPPRSQEEPPDGSSRDAASRVVVLDRGTKIGVADCTSEGCAEVDTGAPMSLPCSAAGSGSVRCNRKYKVKFYPQEKRIFRYLCNIQTNLQNTNSLQQVARNACKTGSRRLRPCCRRRARSEANPTRRSS